MCVMYVVTLSCVRDAALRNEFTLGICPSMRPEVLSCTLLSLSYVMRVGHGCCLYTMIANFASMPLLADELRLCRNNLQHGLEFYGLRSDCLHHVVA